MATNETDMSLSRVARMQRSAIRGQLARIAFHSIQATHLHQGERRGVDCAVGAASAANCMIIRG